MADQKRSVGRSRSPLSKTNAPVFTDKKEDIEQIMGPSLKKPVKRIESMENDALVESLRTNRENLCTCFDIYELLYQNNVPQRCISHNNFVTLYCQNQNKLLCVNCIFGNVIHKSHRVVPIKNAFDMIVNDNKVMSKKLSDTIDNIKKIEKTAVENSYNAEEGMKKLLNNLDEEFERIKSLISDKYSAIRNIIVDSFAESRAKSDQLVSEITWLKDTYSQRRASLPNNGDEPSELFNHMMLNTLLENEKLDIKMIKGVNLEEIRSETLGELIKIREFLESGRKEKKRFF